MIYVAYNESGEITQKGSYHNPPKNLTYIMSPKDIDINQYRVLNNRLVKKINMSLIISVDKTNIDPDGVDKAIFSNIPNGTDFYINGPVSYSGNITDGTLEFSTDVMGIYTVFFFKEHYITGEFIIVSS